MNGFVVFVVPQKFILHYLGNHIIIMLLHFLVNGI